MDRNFGAAPQQPAPPDLGAAEEDGRQRAGYGNEGTRQCEEEGPADSEQDPRPPGKDPRPGRRKPEHGQSQGPPERKDAHPDRERCPQDRSVNGHQRRSAIRQSGKGDCLGPSDCGDTDDLHDETGVTEATRPVTMSSSQADRAEQGQEGTRPPPARGARSSPESSHHLVDWSIEDVRMPPRTRRDVQAARREGNGGSPHRNP